MSNNFPAVSQHVDSPEPPQSEVLDVPERLGAIFRRRDLQVLVVTLIAYVGLATTLALTRSPHSDEGHFINAAYEFATNQRLAMPMWTSWLETLDEHVYAIMPLYFVMLGSWFKLVGAGLETMRIFSVVGGVVYLLCWFQILRKVSADGLVAMLGVILIGLHYDFINLSTTRYDIWVACFNIGALASYVSLRERNLTLAILVSNACLAAGAMTHPYALFGLVGLFIFVCLLDIRRLRIAMLPVAGIPYAVAFGMWGLYIAQDVDDFVQQFSRNASGRCASWREPLATFKSEIWQRYLVEFGGWREGVPSHMRVKTLILPFYLLGLIACCATRAIRRNSLCLGLLIYAGIACLMLTFLEAHRWYIYLVHVIPLYLAAAALWLSTLIRRGGAQRWLAWSAVGLLSAFSFVVVGYRARLDIHHTLYRPTMEALRQTVKDGDVVAGSAVLGVGIGYAEHVLDDPQLGYATGIQHDFIVVNDDWATKFAIWRETEPEVYQHITRTLQNFELTYEKTVGSQFFRIYARRKPTAVGLAVRNTRDAAIESALEKPLCVTP